MGVMSAYHHGDLREAILAEAANVIRTRGPDALSLRAIAKTLGVSHTAFRHHFGSREGVLTALAIEGHKSLAEALGSVPRTTGALVETGVAYVEYATQHPGHFAVMFRPELLDRTDPDLSAAAGATFAILSAGVRSLGHATEEDTAAATIAAWSIVHGIATLSLTGALDAAQIREAVAGGDLLEITRRASGMLFPQ